MEQIITDELIKKAKEFKDKKLKWHFHIFTPECNLNKTGRYSLILEDNTNDKIYSHDFDEKPMDLGKELLKLLHGNDILGKEEMKTNKNAQSVKDILKKAKELNAKGLFWHHHMLFPDCIFNRHHGLWTLILEDQKNGQILESVTNFEPKEDLKQVETLFYQQSNR